MQWFDDFFEARSRRAAQSISRRSAISRMGKLLVGTAFLLPILPFDRIGKAVAATKANPEVVAGQVEHGARDNHQAFVKGTLAEGSQGFVTPPKREGRGTALWL